MTTDTHICLWQLQEDLQLMCADPQRQGCVKKKLRRLESKTVMMTGSDNQYTAEAIAKSRCR